MKKLLFGALAFLSIALFTACEKDVLTNTLDSSDLTAIDRGGGGDSTLHCMRGDTIDAGELPQDIIDFLEANYSADVVTAVNKRNGRAYAVELSDGTILIFKGNGELLGECGDLPTHPGGPHGPGNGPGHPGNAGGCLGGDTLTVADLPVEITNAIASEYPNNTILTVVSKRNGLAFAIELNDGTVLIYKADGTFVGICSGQPGNGPGHPGGPGNGPGGPGNGPGGPGGPGNGPGGGHGGHGGGH